MRGLKISEILLRIFLVFAGLAAALLVSETILRFTHFQTFILHEATPAGYFSEDTNLGRDITPNIPPTLSPFYDHPYMVWSNELGCFDRPYLGETPYIYLTGDSQTWGYAPYEYKWGTKLEGLLHTRIVKCGVPGYGTMQEFLKTSRDMERLAAPELIIVGYFDNDILDDERQYPRTERKVGTGRHWDGAQSWLNDHSILFGLIQASLNNTGETGPPSQHLKDANFETIVRFNAMARKRGAKFLVVLIPAKNAVITKSHNFKSLKDRLREQHIDFLDPEEEFARFVQKKNTSAYWVYDGHMNLAGNELLGLLVAKYVLENRMVPLKDRDTLLEQTNQAVSNLI